MGEIIKYQESGQEKHFYTLKIFFGSLFGCEFHLPADNYFLVINSVQVLEETNSYVKEDCSAYRNERMLYLPCDVPSPNLVLRLLDKQNEQGSDLLFSVEVQNNTVVKTKNVYENKIFSLDHIHFAIKRSESSWSDNVLNFNSLEGITPRTSVRSKIFILPIKIKPFVLFFIVAILLMFGWNVIHRNQEKSVVSLLQELSGTPAPLKIVESRDGSRIFVFAVDITEMEWLQEALVKIKTKANIIPVLLSQQKIEVIRVLRDAGFPVIQIDFSHIQHPIIFIYEKLSEPDLKRLESQTLEKILFALDVKITLKTSNQILKDAQHGLDMLHIKYHQVTTPGGYSLIISDLNSDADINVLHHFIDEFNKRWGSNIVNFSINMDENWLDNKSFLNASNGYVFLKSNHWLFSLK